MRTLTTLLGTAVAMQLSLSALAGAVTQPQSSTCEVIDGTVVCRTQADPFSGLTQQEKGQVVYKETEVRHGPLMGYGSPGYQDSQSSFRAVIKNSDGSEAQREVQLKYLENAPDGNKRIIVFNKPRDLKRHALLTVSHKNGYDEQWRYNPDTKKITRIQENNAFTPFSGTDLTFEDIGSQDLDKYDYTFIGNDSFQDKAVYRVNRFPKDQHSGYKRLETWVDSDTYLVLKVDYYDRSDRLLKTLTLNDYRLYNDKYWRASKMLMENHQSGRSTQLIWSDYQFNSGLSDADFSLSGLRSVN